MDVRSWGIRTAAAGAVAQGTGLGVDAWMHARDPGLAAREGVFTLTNVGHALFLGGLVLVTAGVLLALAGPILYGPNAGQVTPRGLRTLRVGAPLALVAVLGGGVAVASTSSLSGGHTHHNSTAAESDHSHDDAGAGDLAAPAGGAAIQAGTEDPEHGHGHGVVPDQPMDRATRDELAAQLVSARVVADRFPTVADAEAGGYRMVTPYVPLIGAHYINFGLIDTAFEIGAPEMLLYDGTNSDSRMVGLSYYMLSVAGEPAGFAGPNDHWHQHLGLCMRDGVVIAGEDATDAECEALGGSKADGRFGWMVHAWVVPGWESQQGVFSAENPALT